MSTGQAVVITLIIAGATLLTRALPFIVFSGGRKTPPVVAYLGKVLPYAIIGMLVIYCLKDTQLTAAPHGVPELLGVGVTAGLYLWRKNTLLAITGGTVGYMLLLQLVY